MKRLYDPSIEEIEKILLCAIEKAGTKTRLAKEMNVRQGTVCAWFQGSMPSVPNLRKLARYTKIKITL
jgi:hypothetical protein